MALELGADLPGVVGGRGLSGLFGLVAQLLEQEPESAGQLRVLSAEGLEVFGVLPALALEPGKVVSVDELLDAGWEDGLPANPTNAVLLRPAPMKPAALVYVPPCQ